MKTLTKRISYKGICLYVISKQKAYQGDTPIVAMDRIAKENNIDIRNLTRRKDLEDEYDHIPEDHYVFQYLETIRSDMRDTDGVSYLFKINSDHSRVAFTPIGYPAMNKIGFLLIPHFYLKELKLPHSITSQGLGQSNNRTAIYVYALHKDIGTEYVHTFKLKQKAMVWKQYKGTLEAMKDILISITNTSDNLKYDQDPVTVCGLPRVYETFIDID